MVNRGLTVALGLSLAANVFLGGFLAGKIAGQESGREPPRFERRHGGHGDHDDMSPAARDALHRAFQEHRDDNAEVWREMRELHRELIDVITAETFDRAAAETVAAKFEALDASFRSDMARIMIEAAEGLSLEDRKTLARHLEKRLKRGGRRDDKPEGTPAGPPPEDGPPAE